MPASEAACTSMLSSPTPARATTSRLGRRSSSAASTCVRLRTISARTPSSSSTSSSVLARATVNLASSASISGPSRPSSATTSIIGLDPLARVQFAHARERGRLAVLEVLGHRRSREDRVAGGDRGHDAAVVRERAVEPAAVAGALLELLLVQVLDRLHD